MILPLTKDFRVETTSGGAVEFVLKRRHVVADMAVGGKVSKRAGEVEWRTVGYYSSLEGAFQRVPDHHISSLEGEVTLADVVREIRSLKELVKEALG